MPHELNTASVCTYSVQPCTIVQDDINVHLPVCGTYCRYVQVVASDIGATVLGVNEANVRQYMLELMYAVVAGQLPAPKFAVGLKASGVKLEAQAPDVLVQLLWCAASGNNSACMCAACAFSGYIAYLTMITNCLHRRAGRTQDGLQRCISTALTGVIWEVACLQGHMDTPDLQADRYC